MKWHFLVLTLGLLHSFKYFKWFCNVSLLFKVRFLWITRTFFRFTYISCGLNAFDKKLLPISSALLFKRKVGIELLWNQQLNFVMPRYMMTNILSLVFFVFFLTVSIAWGSLFENCRVVCSIQREIFLNFSSI